jgi:lysophospholipase L1-like esterase
MGIRMALLGDSIAWGQGADRAGDRLGARLVDGLRRRGIEAVSRVAAVPGARSRDLERQVDAVLPWRPDLAVVVIGANDLTHLEPVGPAVEALRLSVRRLRDVGAEVVVAPAPDLSAVPHVPPALREVVRVAGGRFRSEQAAAVVAEGGRVADRDQAASRAFAADPTLFSRDGFHPSSRGYAVIAEALLPEVLQATRVAEGVGEPRC